MKKLLTTMMACCALTCAEALGAQVKVTLGNQMTVGSTLIRL